MNKQFLKMNRKKTSNRKMHQDHQDHSEQKEIQWLLEYIRRDSVSFKTKHKIKLLG